MKNRTLFAKQHQNDRFDIDLFVEKFLKKCSKKFILSSCVEICVEISRSYKAKYDFS